MKQIKVLIMIGLLIGLAVLGGCNRLFSYVTDNTEEVTQEEGFADILPLAEDDVDYYRSYSGSSSVYTEYGIYKYEDSFIFVVNYFNCGNFYRETFQLTVEQTEVFMQELNQYRAVENPATEEEPSEGDWGSDCEVSVNGSVYCINGISLTELGISLQENPDIQEEVSEELTAYADGNLEGLGEAGKAHMSFMMNGTLDEPGYYCMIQEQITTEVFGKVTKAAVIEQRDYDFLLQLTTDQGETWQATVTYLGYVADIQKLSEN